MGSRIEIIKSDFLSLEKFFEKKNDKNNPFSGRSRLEVTDSSTKNEKRGVKVVFKP